MLLLLNAPFVNLIKANSTNCKNTPPQSTGPFYKVPSKIFNNDMTNNGKAIGKRIKVYGFVSFFPFKRFKTRVIPISGSNNLSSGP